MKFDMDFGQAGEAMFFMHSRARTHAKIKENLRNACTHMQENGTAKNRKSRSQSNGAMFRIFDFSE